MAFMTTFYFKTIELKKKNNNNVVMIQVIWKRFIYMISLKSIYDLTWTYVISFMLITHKSIIIRFWSYINNTGIIVGPQ